MRSLLACPLLALMVGCATATAPSLVGDDDDVPVDARVTDGRLTDARIIDASIDAPALQTITLSQAGSTTVAAAASVACTDTATGISRQNSYYRVFRLADFGVNRPFTPTMVSFGVEQATAGAGAAQTVQVKLYTLSGALLVQNMINVAGNNATIPNSGIATVNVPIAPAPIIQPGSTLVAEVFVPDGLAVGNIFFIGANMGTETATGYLRAPDCGIAEPTTYAAIGFGTVRLVLSVTGTY